MEEFFKHSILDVLYDAINLDFDEAAAGDEK